jgi:adenylate cyclase
MKKSKTTATVLFFDLKGWYRQSQGRDAADIAAELDSFYGMVIESAAKHGGRVVKFMGDAGLLLFGSPDNAVSFARDLGKDREVHVGIETGEVVSGTFGKGELQWFDAIGEPVNRAAKNMRRAAKAEKDILLGPSAWEALSAPDREDLACSENL